MATTVITVAAFQTACAEVADAIAAEDWSTAANWYARAEAINAGLDVEAELEGQKSRRRETLAGLAAAIAMARAVASRQAGSKRLIRTTTQFAGS